MPNLNGCWINECQFHPITFVEANRAVSERIMRMYIIRCVVQDLKENANQYQVQKYFFRSEFRQNHYEIN